MGRFQASAAILLACAVAVDGCAGSHGGDSSPQQPGPVAISAAEAAAKITTAATARDAIETTWRALAMGGVAVADDRVPAPPDGLRAGSSTAPPHHNSRDQATARA